MDYKRITIYLSLLIIAVLTIVLLKDCSQASQYQSGITARDFDEIKKDGVIRVVTEYNQTGYFVKGDTILGFQYDLANLFGKAMGLSVEIYPEMDLQKSIAGLESGQYDIIARNLPVTVGLREKVSLSEPLILNKQVLIQRTAKHNNGIDPIRNQLDLAKKTLHVPEGSPSLLRINNLSIEIGDTVYVKEMNKYESEQLIIMVAKGHIDYAVCDEITAKNLKSRFPEIDIDTDISFTQLQAWAVRKDSYELLDSLNSWIIQLKNDKVIEKIQLRYFR